MYVIRQILSILQAFSQEMILSLSGRASGAIIVQISENGDIIRSLQDPTSSIIQSVSSVDDNDGILYMGSYKAPFIGKIKVSAP